MGDSVYASARQEPVSVSNIMGMISTNGDSNSSLQCIKKYKSWDILNIC